MNKTHLDADARLLKRKEVRESGEQHEGRVDREGLGEEGRLNDRLQESERGKAITTVSKVRSCHG